uniref:Zinc knuckle domain-like n=1 Tax=Oryza sativa subsp. japonica TaxID=39947 RepID=Q5Z468_ORYSJ|nr:zinc knuckle domain-like [Oryza sativa Japonica Group]BAD62445.1 zinc knuckle domain-like [Oryza sativa Japonica Group]
MVAGPPVPVSFPTGRSLPLPTYLNPARASLARFRPLPHRLPAGIELAPLPSLSSIADDLRPAFSARRDRLPPRRRLLRLCRTAVDPVHPLAESADRRNTVDPVDPRRATAFLRSGRLFRRRRQPRSGRRVGAGCQPPAPSGAADAWDPRHRPVRARNKQNPN